MSINHKKTANGNIAEMTRVALCAACLCVLSQITIPMPSSVPITLQTLGIVLIGGILGSRRGAICVLVYLALGAIGLPVFSGLTGGIGRFAGPTGGFLIGFIPMAALSGMKKNAVTSFLGLAVCHLLGSSYYAVTAGIPFIEAAMLVSAPYLIKDALSAVIGVILSRRIKSSLARLI